MDDTDPALKAGSADIGKRARGVTPSLAVRRTAPYLGRAKREARMLTGLLVFAMVVLRGFPETTAARWLERMTWATLDVVRRIERRHLVFLIIMSLLLTIGIEALAVAGPIDTATIVVMWDISTYIDIVLTTVALATAARGAVGWRMLVARVAPRRATLARRRRRVARKAAAPANEDDRPGFALAA